ncbi:MAG: hypothetical protein JNL80_02515 [Phycisphaerae bacterium]|nr:hypothetical protein [Phycisphaerae bacterium]
MPQLLMKAGATAIALCLAACGESRMTLDGDMAIRGELNLQGPIRMEISGPSINYSGTYVSEALFDHIDAGETKADWILAVLGEPDARTGLNDGTEIWRWAYQPNREQLAAVTVWSTGEKEEPRVRQSLTFVQLRDGVVLDKWRD